MSYEAANSWIENAKLGALGAPKTPAKPSAGRVAKSKGNIIMEVAEMLCPWLMKMLDGVRDKHGMLVQPASVRGIALNVAQDIVNKHEEK